MPVTGSSLLDIKDVNKNLTGVTGITGNTGPIGPTGPHGNTIRGSTGNTGVNLVNISKLNDDFLKFTYSDSTEKFSTSKILGYTGYSKIVLTGITLNTFSILRNSQQNTVINDNGNKYPVDILTVRGICSASQPYVRITTTNDTINVNFEALNLGYIGICGGPDNSIIQNLPGQFQSGITGTKYDEENFAITIQNSNVQETLNIVRPVVFNNAMAVWKIDPDLGSFFYIIRNPNTLSTDAQVKGNVFCIKKPKSGSLSKGLSLYFSAEFKVTGVNTKFYYVLYEKDSDIDIALTTSHNFNLRLDTNGIEWQNNSYFCPTDNKINVLNLISLGSRYLAIPAVYDATSTQNLSRIYPNQLSNSCNPNIQNLQLSSSFTSGMCCPKTCNITGTETMFGLCDGYFYHEINQSGFTYCDLQGSCCTRPDINLPYIKTQKTYCECAESVNNDVNLFYWNPFVGIKNNLSWFDCNLESGCCCKGDGNSKITTEKECISNSYFYQGNGVKCSNGLINICSTGTGGCCDSGNICNDNINATGCLPTKSFLGDSKKCVEFTCSAESIPCLQTIPGYEQLKQGDEFAGGIIAGLFKISKNNIITEHTIISGHSSFKNGTSYQQDNSSIFFPNNLTTYFSQNLNQNYTSVYDYSGYGFTDEESDSENFIVIISKDDLKLSDNNLFLWSKSNFMWGPIYDPNTNEISDIGNSVNSLNPEGYVFAGSSVPNIISPSEYNTLLVNTFLNNKLRNETTDPLEWLSNRSEQQLNGLWMRNYGLYNTARMVGSILAASNSAFGSKYMFDTSIDGTTVTEAIIQYNIDNPPTSNRESSWFIPSHDEMAYIVQQISNNNNFNLNSNLLLIGGEIIEGNYWTSTGSFDLNNNEGITINANTPSMAWYYDVKNNTATSSIKNRLQKYKVRPIKIIRCDGRFSNPSDTNYKLWRLPEVNF